MQKGNIWLIPNTLGGEQLHGILPKGTIDQSLQIRSFAVEEIKSARRLLRKMDREFPIDECVFFEMNKRTSPELLQKMIAHLKNGHDIGIISEAGCPELPIPALHWLRLRTKNKYVFIRWLDHPPSFWRSWEVGFLGQSFTFHGYLPKERKDRVRKLKDFEADSRRNGNTHIFMETPFRNMNVLEDLLNELADQTLLCIASDLTLNNQSIRSMTVKEWRDNAYDLSKIPTMFLIQSFQ